MDKIYIFLIIISAIAVIVSVLVYMSKGLRRTYLREVRAGIDRTSKKENALLTEEDIKHLPRPVQRYLTYVGAIGKEKVHSFRMAVESEMKLDPHKEWVKFKCEQYNFLDDQPTRLFYIKTKMFGIPVLGLHSYTREKASMLIKLAGLITVLDSKGPEMRISDTTTLFNDMCGLAPSTLIDQRISWEEIDDLTVKATFEAFGCRISANLYFNETGELISFVSDDRYYMPMDGSCQKRRWSTPFRNYQEKNGFKLATYGEAIWSLPEGDYCYAKFANIEETTYNCKSLG